MNIQADNNKTWFNEYLLIMCFAVLLCGIWGIVEALDIVGVTVDLHCAILIYHISEV